ncbi:hypothetical protein [Chroococcidiopsis sp. CCMEE 29]|uniref:hypothetical protein n=1 Tax=Chroococcidiopsis sp. CCMEE 29 TaxID=155894 RepID=UPI002020CABE|nr:hypothetical protein [Chroococcidiopsis sp. CCMEE 29]
MQSIKLRSHVGEDGMLQISVPIGMTDVDLEVMVIVQPIVKTESAKTPEELGWPPGFFERTAGAIPDLERPPQGEYEARESL